MLALAAGSVPAAPPQPELGHKLSPLAPPRPATGFELPDMDGKVYALKALKGQVVMLNFWATWCPPCRRELPSMEALYRLLKQDGFTVLAINQWEDPDHVFAFTGQLSPAPTFPILFEKRGDLAKAYGVKGLPTTFIIDKQGNVVYRAVGGRDFEHPEVVGIIRGLLGQ